MYSTSSVPTAAAGAASAPATLKTSIGIDDVRAERAARVHIHLDKRALLSSRTDAVQNQTAGGRHTILSALLLAYCRSSRLSSSILLSSASSPPQSSSTSCHSGLGSPRHCLSATGRAHATGCHEPSSVQMSLRTPTNQRKSSGDRSPRSTASTMASTPPVKMRVPGQSSVAPSSSYPWMQRPMAPCSSGPPQVDGALRAKRRYEAFDKALAVQRRHP